MSSLRRILSSRANGARSRGPKTPAGKAASSRNAIRHGLLATCIVLENESEEGFRSSLNEYLARFDPADEVELGLVEELVAAYWRLRRAWAIETRLFDQALEASDAPDQRGRLAAAFTALAATPTLALLHRYETRLHLMYRRSLHDLLLLQTCETNPVPSPETPLGPPTAPCTPPETPHAESAGAIEPIAPSRRQTANGCRRRTPGRARTRAYQTNPIPFPNSLPKASCPLYNAFRRKR